MPGWLLLLLLLFLLLIVLLARWVSGLLSVLHPFRMTTPYVNESDIDDINEAYSESNNCPWNGAHDGIDFFPPVGSRRDFQAVCDGVVQEKTLSPNDHTGNLQVNITIQYNNTFSVEYAFEPMSAEQGDGQEQWDAIVVSVGETVSSGQIIGQLHAAVDGAHVHFSLKENGTPICPEPYFTPAAHASIMTILQNSLGPTVQMCYP